MIESVLVLVTVAALWVAAIAFGRDTRDGSDRSRRTDFRAPFHTFERGGRGAG